MADYKQNEFFKRLNRLFSTNVVVRSVGGKKLKVLDTDNLQAFSKTATNMLYDKFTRLYSSRTVGYGNDQYVGTYPFLTSRYSLYSDYDLMDSDPTVATALDIFADETCLSGETIIPLPDGNDKTLKELSELYPNKDTKFYVWSYDKKSDSIKIGNAHSVRKTKTDMTYKITFDNGKYIIGTGSHIFLMRNGEEKRIDELKINDSVLPFYSKRFWKERYKFLYNFSKGWQAEHRMVLEQFDRKLKKNEVGHHMDFNKTNNLPSNLRIMTKSAHSRFHLKINNEKIWSKENYDLQVEKIRNGIKNGKKHHWNGERVGESNPFYGKKHSIDSNIQRSNSIKEFRNEHKDFQIGEKNPNYRHDISFNDIKNLLIDRYKNFECCSLKEISEKFKCDRVVIWNRLKENNFNTFTELKNHVSSTLNHKIISIEPHEIIDVYDMTVDEYHNFATDSCFVHNCLRNEYGNILEIKSDDNNIKKILHNLFYDILNIEFNLWPWTRNLVKYGDHILKLDISEKYGIVNVIPLNIYEIGRDEGFNPKNPYETRFIHRGMGGAETTYQSFEVAHFRMLSDSNYMPYGKSIIESGRKIWKQLCLRGDSKIWTPSGYTEIKDIKEGDDVYSYDFEKGKVISSKVSKWKCNGEDDIYEVKTSHRRLYANKTHPILMPDGTYKSVCELTKNDCVILPKIKNEVNYIPDFTIDSKYLWANLNENGKRKIGKFRKKIKEINNYKKNRFLNGKSIPATDAYRILNNLQISTSLLNVHPYMSSIDIVDKSIFEKNIKEFVRFFGFMFGDGWIDYSRNSISFSLGDRLDKSEKYIDILKKLGFLPKSRLMNSTKRYCNVNSVYLVKLFEKLGFVTGTENKNIPDWIYKLSSELQTEFLMGFIDADGCEIKDGWSVGGINSNLIYGFQNIAQRNGFVCGKVVEYKGGKDAEWGGKWRKTKNFYGLAIKKKSNRVKDFNDISKIEKVLSVKYIGKDKIYDIQVDNDLHNFISDGMVVHNTLMEDAMLIHRIMRAPERRIFKIDVANIPPNEIDSHMQNIINSMKKIPFMDESSGDYNLRFNLMNMLEDYYVPVRGATSGTEIDTLPGMQFNGMDDIKYLMYRFLSSIRMPNAFLGFEEYLEGKSSLAALDVRFARTVERVQNAMLEQFYKIAVIHLFSQGYTDENLINFELKLTTPSIVYENEKIALWSEKIRIAKDFKDSKLFGDEWIYKNIFGLSTEQISDELKSVLEATKRTFRYAQIEGEGNDPAVTKESFGTPHDLAVLYMKNKYFTQSNRNGFGDETIDYGTPAFDQYTGFLDNGSHHPLTSTMPANQELPGRPPEGLKYKTDKHPMGRNPLGQKDLEKTLDVDTSIKHNFRDNSPLAYNESVRKNIKDLLNMKDHFDKKKQILTEMYDEVEDSQLNTDGTYLDDKLLNENIELDNENLLNEDLENKEK